MRDLRSALVRVVVLGGTIFIGRAVVEELVDVGHEVVVVHRGEHELEPGSGFPDVEHVHLERSALARGVGPADAVVDTFALSRPDAEAGVAAVAGDVRRLVLSSMDVYRAYGSLHAGATTDAVPLDEGSPVRDQRFPYRGVYPDMDDYDKLDVEEVYLGAGATVCRLPMTYGPHDGQRREGPWLRRLRAGRMRIPTGSGTFLWSKGWVGDMALGVRLALEADAAGEVFNLCERRTVPMGLWAEWVVEAAGGGVELVRVPDRLLPPDLRITGRMSQPILVDSCKARERLGWTEMDPRDALRRSVEWHLANPPTEVSEEDWSADDKALASASWVR